MDHPKKIDCRSNQCVIFWGKTEKGLLGGENVRLEAPDDSQTPLLGQIRRPEC